jgi:hypothetical protein
MSNITISLVTKDGSVDQEASRQAFDTALSKYIAERETEESTIAAAVSAVFDKFPGAAVNMPALASMALQHLNALPSNYSTLDEKCKQYVRDNAGARESGKLFVIGKGKNGGVKRWADQPAAAPEAPASETPAA